MQFWSFILSIPKVILLWQLRNDPGTTSLRHYLEAHISVIARPSSHECCIPPRLWVNTDTISTQITDMNNFATINEVRPSVKALKALYDPVTEGAPGAQILNHYCFSAGALFITVLICIWHGYLVLCKFASPDCNLSSFITRITVLPRPLPLAVLKRRSFYHRDLYFESLDSLNHSSFSNEQAGLQCTKPAMQGIQWTGKHIGGAKGRYGWNWVIHSFVRTRGYDSTLAYSSR